MPIPYLPEKATRERTERTIRDLRSLLATIVSSGGIVLIPNGTQAAPGLAFASDLDLGVYRVASNKAALVSNNVVMLIWENSVGVTIGVALIVNGTVAATGNITSDGDLKFKSGTAFTLSFEHAFASANRVVTFQDLAGTVPLLGAANVGDLGLGTAPSYAIHVTKASSGGRVGYIANTDSANASDGLYVETTSVNAATKILQALSAGSARFYVRGDGAIVGRGITYQTSEAVGSTAGPTYTGGFTDLAEMSVTLTTIGGNLEAEWSGNFSNTGAGNLVGVQMLLDGAALATSERAATVPTAGGFVNMNTRGRWTGVAAGSHTVKVQVSTGAGTTTANGTLRSLIVREVGA